ncbi:MAG: hypothetical protein AAFX81_20835 [Pseudomonadota bacterium]
MTSERTRAELLQRIAEAKAALTDEVALLRRCDADALDAVETERRATAQAWRTAMTRWRSGQRRTRAHGKAVEAMLTADLREVDRAAARYRRLVAAAQGATRPTAEDAEPGRSAKIIPWRRSTARL